ncbi:MAG: hypothetical protein JST93_14140 [Acidobacteria bacterium]|nr:hypothetical protein [Acidobacteriota bacterium]
MAIQDEQLLLFVAHELVRMIRADNWTGSDVLSLIVLLRKIAEIEADSSNDGRRLRFYLDLPLHHRMDRELAQRFLDEIEKNVGVVIQAARAGQPRSIDAENKLGSLLSFSEFRRLLTRFLSEKSLLPRFLTDERWVRFVVGYAGLIGQSGVTIINDKDQSAVIEAQVSALSVDDDQGTISWEWTFKMRNGDIGYLIPRLDLTKLVETREMHVFHTAPEAADAASSV